MSQHNLNNPVHGQTFDVATLLSSWIRLFLQCMLGERMSFSTGLA